MNFPKIETGVEKRDDWLIFTSIPELESELRIVFTKNRRLNLGIILALDYYPELPTTIRTRLDYIFAFANPQMRNIRAIHEQFYFMIPTFELFDQILTENECLVVNNTSSANLIYKL